MILAYVLIKPSYLGGKRCFFCINYGEYISINYKYNIIFKFFNI